VEPFHKTIICHAFHFDSEYKKWKESLNLLPSQSFNKIDIKHDGDNHYILYTITNLLNRRT